MSRELCVFEKFDLTMVPLKKRKYALKKQVSAYSPFKEFSYSTIWSDGWAAVWIWDQNLQNKAALQINKKKDFTICAESSLVPAQDDGLFGYKAEDGFFLQLWKERKLISEISWPSEPSMLAVNEFVQLNGAAYNVSSVDWQDVQFRFSFQQIFIKEPERIANFSLVFSLSLFVIFSTFQLLSIARLEIELNRLDGQSNQIRQEKKNVVDLRSDAVTLRDFNQRAAALAKPKQLELMSVLAENLKEEKSNLIDWDFDGLSIRANLSDISSPVNTIVERLESTEKFAGISVDIDSLRNRITITMEVIGED